MGNSIWGEKFIGKVVTVKLITGSEMIGKLVTLTAEMSILEYPHLVVIGKAGEIGLVPFQFTCDTPAVEMATSAFLSISKTAAISETDYDKIVEDRKR